MRKDYIWPIICAILVSSLALAIFPFGKPVSFYKIFSGLSINWKLGGVWIDLLLDVSFTYIFASAFAALIASLAFKRSFYLANLTGLVSAVLYALLTLVATSRSQIVWQPFNIFYFTTLHISECVVIFFIVSYWAKIGCFINQYLTRH